MGSANGYSGNGIWEENISGVKVSKMDLSFYGIGKTTVNHRSFDMATHQDAEQAFGEMMATPGTQFRFRQDPNQIVYTVTHAEVSNMFNYETGHGSWKVDGGSDGGGLGKDVLPPSSDLQGKTIFISDLFNFQNELTGGAPYNYRTRITLTLDKEIGAFNEGIPLGTSGAGAGGGFHPIKNHVDINGNCNIKGGPQIYAEAGPDPTVGWRGEIGWFPEEFGGTLSLDRFYNLSSYWNYVYPTITNAAPDTGQSSEGGVGNMDGQHFGLHERGLNATTIEIVTAYKGDEGVKKMSSNPAIWETEPMEDVGLDIYYAASPTYPIKLSRFRSDLNMPDTLDLDALGNTTEAHYFDYGWRGEEIVPVGCKVKAIGTPVVNVAIPNNLLNPVS